MGLVAFLLWRLRDRVRPGVIFALYCLLSGLERFLVEFVRRNKEVLARPHLAAAGERRLMIVGAVWLALMMRGAGRGPATGRRRAPRGGWLRGARDPARLAERTR